MRTNRAVDLQRQYAARIEEVYSESIHFGRSHKEHIERMKEMVWNPSQEKKVPYWLRSYLRGYDHAKWNALYAVRGSDSSLLEAVSIGPDARIFARNNDEWLKEDHAYKEAMHCEYRWRNQPEKYW